jgi:hypothetical protein
MPWSIELDFATCHEDADGYWDGVEDTVTKTFIFHTEKDAREFHREALRIIAVSWERKELADDDPWDPDGLLREEQPPDENLEFCRKHNVTVFDLDGVPCGGYFKGERVPGYDVALQGILQVVKYEDLTREWGAECESPS